MPQTRRVHKNAILDLIVLSPKEAQRNIDEGYEARISTVGDQWTVGFFPSFEEATKALHEKAKEILKEAIEELETE